MKILRYLYINSYIKAKDDNLKYYLSHPYKETRS